MPSPVLQSRVAQEIFEAFTARIDENGLDQRVIVEALMVHFIDTDETTLRRLIKARQAFVQAQSESQAQNLVDAAKRAARARRPKR